MSHNTDLTNVLNETESQVNKATSESDLIAAVENIKKFINSGKSLKYNIGGYLIAGLVFLGAAALLAYQSFVKEPFIEWEIWKYILIALLAIAGIVFLVVTFEYGGRVDSLSDLIFNKDIHFDNNLTSIAVKDYHYETLANDFGDFDRGDEGQKITELLEGKYNFEGKEYPYKKYTFEYVEVTYVAVPTGKTVTIQRQTETCYRYGIVMPFPWVKGVVVKNCGGGSYSYNAKHSTGSGEFNRIYDVFAESELTAAKFLVPAVIIELIDAGRYFSELCIEINSKGYICISSDDSDILSIARQHSLENPDEFIKEISLKNHPVKLQRILKLFSVLKEYNDSNF